MAFQSFLPIYLKEFFNLSPGKAGIASSVFPLGSMFSVLIGGFIFGIGMVYGGGCASGTLYRAGEGYLHYWLVLISACVGYVIFAALFSGLFLPYFFIPLQIFEGYSIIQSLEVLAPLVPISIILGLVIYLRKKNQLDLLIIIG